MESWIRQTADAVPGTPVRKKRLTRKTVSLQFRSMLAPPVSLIERIAAGDPTNPFCTAEYVSAIESQGAQTCMIGLWEGDEPVIGCFGFLTGSFLRRSLSVPSLPGIPEQQVFWAGLMQLSRELKIWRLEIDTYGSPAVEIPQLQGELTRRTRWEYVMDLTCENILDGVSSHHRRNITRAMQSGLVVQLEPERVRLRAAPGTHEIIDAATGRPRRGGRYRARQ